MKRFKLSGQQRFALFVIFLVASFGLILWLFFLNGEVPESIIKTDDTWPATK